jgi:hypothetical protein
MSPNIVEILGVNLEPSMKPYRHDDRFVCWLPGEPISEQTSHPDAVRGAIALGDEGCVGFLADEPVAAAPVAVDYSKPLPGILSRRKQKSPPSL